MPVPRIAAVHDLSCFGRCSLTVAIPVLSAMGCQCCPLPTALLSAHTAFQGGTFLDLTEEMPRIAAHWGGIPLRFDCIYSGFLGSPAQVETVTQLIRRFREGAAVVVDPVMGDHGRAYRTCTPELCAGIRQLAQAADVITPNLTEAALLLEQPYAAIQAADSMEVIWRLSLEGRRSVVLTGYSAADGQTGALCFDRGTGQVQAVQTPREPGDFPGTGDLFASVLAGGLARGTQLFLAAQAAADFVRVCVKRTLEANTPPRNGVEFEPLLGLLTGR